MTNNDYATHYTKEKGGNWYQFPAYVKIDKKDLLKTYVSKNRPNIVIGTLLESFLVHTILFSNGTTWDCNFGLNVDLILMQYPLTQHINNLAQ